MQLLKDAAVLSDHWIGEHVATSYPAELAEHLSPELLEVAQKEIASWPGYEPTPLRELTTFAQSLGVRQLLYKDESNRFGLGSFKALGGAYAVLRYVAETLTARLGVAVTPSAVRKGEFETEAASITVATATDGNHGRSVAWGAKLAGCVCKIYIHAQVSTGREQAMAAFGADVIRIDGDYDESVRLAAAESSKHGWQVISDTSYEGYQEVPSHVMAGYTLMVREILDQTDLPPTHVIVQAGVGGLAAAICAAFWVALGTDRPRFIVTESKHAACIISSARSGVATSVPIEKETIMAGLSCGEISMIAWEVLSRGVNAVATIGDEAVPAYMRELAKLGIEAGECAVPGIITLSAIVSQPELATSLKIDSTSRVLVFGCEGATDAELYQSIIAATD